jgi:SAM-dependent methyltransferase
MKSSERLEVVNAMTDPDLDALFPPSVRRVAGRFWTPVAVTRRAASLLSEYGARRVLDVGSGPGKFCVVAAAHARHLSFVGVEHRPHLVAIARLLADKVGAARVTFQVGDAACMSWTEFDAFYVFNSFAENRFARVDQFDRTVELSRKRYVADLLRVERCLARAPVGALLVTYFGLGGPIPGSYERLHVEAAGNGWLQVWRRANAAPSTFYWLEDDSEIAIVKTDALERWLTRESNDELVATDGCA